LEKDACTNLFSKDAVAPGNMAATDRLTLLLGGSAAGDFKLKPLLVCHLINHTALKGMLPVIWAPNSNNWVTVIICQDRFIFQFVPPVRQYCSRNNLALKVILLLDSAPGHP
jgi:hypothetical protein